MKPSEAKLIIFMRNADKRFCYAWHMANKLELEYSYVAKILKGMEMKGWVKKFKRESKIFYSTTFKTPNKQAKEVLTQ
jgi:DNA-binding MarR family transcriptional regulator|tara:strand:+ start:1427 stop:1660 length:234 start_codon:yes stop_codon:yes gene_type:complete